MTTTFQVNAPVRLAGRFALVAGCTAMLAAASGVTAMSAGAQPSVAEACSQQNVAGTWHEKQSNDPLIILHFTQHGTTLGGKAVNPPPEAKSLGYKTGRIVGSVKGSHIDFVVHWQRSTITGDKNLGHYFGNVKSSSMRGGANNIAHDPATQETWTARGHARCAKR